MCERVEAVRVFPGDGLSDQTIAYLEHAVDPADVARDHCERLRQRMNDPLPGTACYCVLREHCVVGGIATQNEYFNLIWLHRSARGHAGRDMLGRSVAAVA